MFYRICRLRALNIQLIFVFDGPSRPWKRGKSGGGLIDYRERDLLKEMLTCFGIPFDEAPGEAEAECARMQIFGLVDAVWSQNSDCLMFGCTYWIRDDRVSKTGGTSKAKENTEKSKKTARVVRARDLQEPLSIDRSRRLNSLRNACGWRLRY
jgi:Holliday junction resolvase YEN1